jgi:hypothetical protein
MNVKKTKKTDDVNLAKGEQDVFEAIRAQLTPHAVAAIAWRLKFNNSSFTNNDDVDRQVRWFTEQLTALLGDADQRDRLAKELGL